MLGIKRELSAVRYTIFITEKCNWNCEYCDIPTQSDRQDANRHLLERYLPILNTHKVDLYTITGGEPGLSDNVDYFFDTITGNIKVNTNGTFFDRYYEKYCDRIHHIGYHAIKHPGEPLPDNPIIYKSNVSIYVPFNKHNWHLIPDMIQRYPGVRFNFIPHVCKTIQMEYDKFLDSETLTRLRDMIRDGTNTGLFDNYIVNEDNLHNHRLFCMNSNTRYLFDFVRGYIYRCPQSRVHNSRVVMNDENIKRVGDMTLFPESKCLDTACNTCYYFTMYMKYAIRNNILTVNESRHTT